jgi:ATP-dependent RNA helicase RhlE
MQTDSFKSLSLHPRLLQALIDEGYTEPTPIQIQAIPVLLEGNDLLASAQTGTGKTAAFALPTLQLLHDGAQALILTPTRELAMQIEESFQRYGKHLPLRAAVIVGGVSQVPQVKAIKNKPDIIVATPGRLLDLMRQGQIRLDKVEILILDEADRMLDMGFIDDVKKIVNKVPRRRQTMFFSATLSNEVLSLASNMLDHPTEVAVAPPATIAGSINQQVMFVSPRDKRLLLTHVVQNEDAPRTLVFTRTKREADRVVQHLEHEGISADAMHSDKNQAARQRALASFAKGKIQVLVATDVMSRGIDVDGITHVINYEMPSTSDNYVHRIGRTARAGAAGIALSLCDASEVPMINDIKNRTESSIEVIETHPFHSSAVALLYSGNGKKSTSKARAGWRSFRPRGQRMMR